MFKPGCLWLVQSLVLLSRYRPLDAIPFTRSLRFDMELWHWAETNVNFAPTAAPMRRAAFDTIPQRPPCRLPNHVFYPQENRYVFVGSISQRVRPGSIPAAP